MTSKTDKNFIYDYLIHLDSFLLHGVAEVGAPPKTPQLKEILSSPNSNKSEPFQNKSSLIAFIATTEGKKNSVNIFEQNEEQLFLKIVASMGLSPSDIYVTSAPRQSTSISEITEQIKNELLNTNCQYIVCLGKGAANYFSNIQIEAYHVEEVWQSIDLFQKELNLVIIPSIAEMLSDARHKKAAWAQLKRVVEQIKDSI